MTATATTTIQDVSVLSKRRHNDDLFDITLSADGIDILRSDRPVKHMSWDRVTEWEIEEREHDVLLTLRGRDASTPLVVPGWSVDDLEVLMRELTAGSIAYVPEEPGPEEPALEEPERVADEAEPTATATAAPAAPAAPAAAAVATPPSQPTARAARRRRQQRALWRPVVTVLLLGIVALAVTLVLLQSAGVINWGFLGPTA